MRRRRSTNFNLPKFNKELIIDAIIASVVVQQAPKLLNQYLFTSSPLSGDLLEVAGGAAAYLVGMLFKKPAVSNIGLALAAADIANSYIGTMLLPAPKKTGEYSNVPLQDYTNSILPSYNYEAAYN